MDLGRRALLIAASLACACGAGDGNTDGGIDLGVPDAARPPPFCDDHAGPDAGPAATFANVQRIFDENCIGCHCCEADLVLLAGKSFGNLVNQPAPLRESCGGLLVKPGDPPASFLYTKLSSATPCKGQRMPIEQQADGTYVSAPLPGCEQDLVRRWILDGAPP